MASTFFDRIDELADAVGHGTLRVKLEVDQVYAHYQHEGTEFAHPRGGQAHFLRDALYEDNDERLAKLAARLITPDGSEIRQAAIDAAEDLDQAMHDRAPVEHGNLRNSGHPSVTDDGAEIYDRAPHVHRLTEAELRSEHKRRNQAIRGEALRDEHRRLRGTP